MKKNVLGILAALFVFALLFPATGRATNDVYAILYDDGTLVFQNGNTPEPGHAVTNTYAVDLDKVYTGYPSNYALWFHEKESVCVVNFADKISPSATAYWFYGCENLERVDNIQNLDTANVTDMSCMFDGCSRLRTLDVSHFDTANVTDMSCMFSACRELTALDVSGFDTANVTSMHTMFSYCIGLTALDLSHFDTSKVTSMLYMFSACSGLTALDVSGVDTASVTSMACMFGGCSGLTALDVSHFDTANVTSMYAMFSGCSNLRTIYASDKFRTASVPENDLYNSQNMFYNCTSLVGGNGTRFDSRHTDKRYARIDTASTPGYFTYKAAPVSYAITAAAPGTSGQLSVTLTNPDAATFAVAYFDTNLKFVSVDVQSISANAGTVTSSVPANATTFCVMLFDNGCRPLCSPFEAAVR